MKSRQELRRLIGEENLNRLHAAGIKLISADEIIEPAKPAEGDDVQTLAKAAALDSFLESFNEKDTKAVIIQKIEKLKKAVE
jgi:hypothetical protein